MNVILQKLPEHLGVTFQQIKKMADNGLIHPVRRDEMTGLELFNVSEIQKSLPEIEAKLSQLEEHAALEQRARDIAQQLESAQAKARQTGNHDLILRAQILAREQREIETKLQPAPKAPDVATLQTELAEVRQQRDKAQARAKQTAYRDDIFEYQRLDRRAKELEKQIQSAQ